MDSVFGWKRITSTTFPQLLAAVLFVVGSAFAICLSAQLVARGGEWQINPVLGIVLIYGFLGLWLTFAWRMMRIGIYVSDAGVRIRTTLRTRSVSWSDVAAVDLAPATLGAEVDAVWLRLAGGGHIETPVSRRRKRQPLDEVGETLPGDECANVVQLLRRRISVGPNAPSE
jgi:hypothetical protein